MQILNSVTNFALIGNEDLADTTSFSSSTFQVIWAMIDPKSPLLLLFPPQRIYVRVIRPFAAY